MKYWPNYNLKQRKCKSGLASLLLLTLVACGKPVEEGCMQCYDRCVSVDDEFYDGICVSEFKNNEHLNTLHPNFNQMIVYIWLGKKLDYEIYEKKVEPLCSDSLYSFSQYVDLREKMYNTYFYCEEVN